MYKANFSSHDFREAAKIYSGLRMKDTDVILSVSENGASLHFISEDFSTAKYSKFHSFVDVSVKPVSRPQSQGAAFAIKINRLDLEILSELPETDEEVTLSVDDISAVLELPSGKKFYLDATLLTSVPERPETKSVGESIFVHEKDLKTARKVFFGGKTSNLGIVREVEHCTFAFALDGKYYLAQTDKVSMPLFNLPFEDGKECNFIFPNDVVKVAGKYNAALQIGGGNLDDEASFASVKIVFSGKEAGIFAHLYYVYPTAFLEEKILAIKSAVAHKAEDVTVIKAELDSSVFEPLKGFKKSLPKGRGWQAFVSFACDGESVRVQFLRGGNFLGSAPVAEVLIGKVLEGSGDVVFLYDVISSILPILQGAGKFLLVVRGWQNVQFGSVTWHPRPAAFYKEDGTLLAIAMPSEIIVP
ncbi:MAG: hypothetical protein QXS68_02975 [Candidatus Methanomethylicaceae archaeon]